MKRVLPLVLVLCLLLAACGPKEAAVPSAGPSAPVEDPSPSPVPSPVPSPTATPTPTPTPAPTPTAASGEYVPPDFSDHAQRFGDVEDYYTTHLTDLTPLERGEKAIVFEVGPDPYPGSWTGEKVEIWGYDACGCDLRDVDLSYILDRNDVTFDTRTLWPSADKLPTDDFDPETILELGKDPGLGVRALHEKGITGEGVGIAILDQNLFTGHQEYRDNLMLYEAIHATSDGQAPTLHAPSVASIAAGKNVGVAPGAKLYLIAGEYTHNIDGNLRYDMSVVAAEIDRVLEINRHLPEGEKIRVISLSLGIDRNYQGFSKLMSAVDRAKAEGILFLTTNPDLFYPEFKLSGLCRDGLSDPNDPLSYAPAAWLTYEKPRYPGELDWPENTILVPMGGRTYASRAGAADYEWNQEGGMSWAVPWLAGFYALCCQADPDCTPERFFEAVQSTATVELIQGKGPRAVFFGKIIDPAAAIEALVG